MPKPDFLLFRQFSSFSFDDIWEPSEKDTPSVGDFNPDPVKIDITKEEVPPALLMKVQLNKDELHKTIKLNCRAMRQKYLEMRRPQ